MCVCGGCVCVRKRLYNILKKLTPQLLWLFFTSLTWITLATNSRTFTTTHPTNNYSHHHSLIDAATQAQYASNNNPVAPPARHSSNRSNLHDVAATTTRTSAHTIRTSKPSLTPPQESFIFFLIVEILRNYCRISNIYQIYVELL